MDWNWFFSSLSQSMAAVVGIFSAFIITKVVNNQNEFAKKNSRLQELLTLTEKHQESITNRYIKWFSARQLKKSLDLLNEELEGSERKTAEEYYAHIKF